MQKRNERSKSYISPVENEPFVIRWDLVRTDKPLDEITAADVPRGLDCDDVCALNPDGTLMLTRKK